MSKLSDEFEEGINYFLQENKNEYCTDLQRNDWKYKSLLTKLHKFIEKLIKDKENKFELEDEFFECFYELMYVEGIFLYKQGYKDCFKLWKMLDE